MKQQRRCFASREVFLFGGPQLRLDLVPGLTDELASLEHHRLELASDKVLVFQQHRFEDRFGLFRVGVREGNVQAAGGFRCAAAASDNVQLPAHVIGCIFTFVLPQLLLDRSQVDQAIFDQCRFDDLAAPQNTAGNSKSAERPSDGSDWKAEMSLPTRLGGASIVIYVSSKTCCRRQEKRQPAGPQKVCYDARRCVLAVMMFRPGCSSRQAARLQKRCSQNRLVDALLRERSAPEPLPAPCSSSCGKMLVVARATVVRRDGHSTRRSLVHSLPPRLIETQFAPADFCIQ
jgi:hypothetical protein